MASHEHRTSSPDAAVAAQWTHAIETEIKGQEPDIRWVADKIHADPELAYEEHNAHATLVSFLRDHGLPVTPHAYGLATAFSCEVGSGGRLVVFNAEYDALPGIGHACGHNLIAGSSLAAFLGVVAALRNREIPGRVRLLGTPAEEGGGGKLKLIAAGAYKGADAALMAHPGPGYLLDEPVRGVAKVKMLANVKKKITFSGAEAHAAMEPWNGVNALDACVLAYNAISMLRQQIRPTERIHGVFRAGGDRPNVIPGSCCLEYYVRSDTRRSAERLWERVKKCFEGAAMATGCGLQIEDLNGYADVRASAALCRAYVQAMPEGTVAYNEPVDFLAGSTDMGNVCYECPGFHGAFGIDTEPGQGNHTKGFAKAAGTDDSFARAMDVARGMAIVAMRVLGDEKFAERMRKEWEVDMKAAAE